MAVPAVVRGMRLVQLDPGPLPADHRGHHAPQSGVASHAPHLPSASHFSKWLLQLVNPSQHSAVRHAARMPITANPVRFTGFV